MAAELRAHRIRPWLIPGILRSTNAMPSRGLSLPSRRSRTSPHRRRRGASIRGSRLHAGPRAAARALATESLEPRALLAVTAFLSGSDLQISLGAADDAAYLAHDGTNYIVRGTGLSGYAAANANVNSVSVAGTAAANQSFTIAAGTGPVLTDPLSVAASVEQTTIFGAVDTAGDVVVDSAAITLAADVTTTGQQRYKGAASLVGDRTLAAGAGNVSFESTVDRATGIVVDTSPATSAPPGTLGGYTMTPFAHTSAVPDDTSVTSVTDGDRTLSFDQSVKKQTIGSGWATWSNGYTGAVYTTTNSPTPLSLTMNLPSGTRAFSFYVEPNGFGLYDVTATYAGGTPAVTVAADGDGGARYFGFSDASGNDLVSITVTAVSGSNGFAVGEFGIGVGTWAGSLVVNTSGATTFGGIVGGTAPLGSLTTDTGGTVRLTSVTTNGAQSYGEDATLDGTYTTTNAAFSVAGASTLIGNTTIATAGGAIAFTGAVNGAKALDLTAGTGNVTFGGTVGGGTPLGAISIASATDVTAGAITAAALSQAAGTGTTTLNGAIVTNTAAGVSLTGTTLAVNSGITTTNDGVVTFNASGTLAIGADGDIAADNAVTLTALGGIVTAGNVTTTNDTVAFASATMLSGPIAIDTGAGSGNITFSGALDGAHTLVLTAGTGGITFDAAVGAAVPLAGIVATSATSFTANSTVVLDGSASNARLVGIELQAVNHVTLTAAGSVIRNFQDSGVAFGSSSTDSTIANVTFTNNAGAGIAVSPGDYTGTSFQRNAISGSFFGIQLDASRSLGSGTLTNLLIGGGVDGDAALGNMLAGNRFGISVTPGTYTGTVIGGGNEIIDNGKDGILLTFVVVNATRVVTGVNDLMIANNFIGVSRDGTPHGNVDTGIRVAPGDHTGTVIQSNRIASNGVGIGLHASEKSSPGLPNPEASLTGLAIGGDRTAAKGNVVEHNVGNGIEVNAGDYTGTILWGNTIRDNGTPLAHTGNGIFIEGSNLVVGWTADASNTNTVANTITGNALNGIEIRGAAATNNTILSNSIALNGYVDVGVPGRKTVVGEGIALTDGANGGQAAPQILRVVDDATDGVVRVHVRVPTAGAFFVQLFANTAADERAIFPADANGFEGRTLVGASLVTGNAVTIIEIPASRVAAGDWLTATATLNAGAAPGNTSPFSAGVQIQNAPPLAVGGEGPVTWAPEYAYQRDTQNQLRVFTSNVQAALVLHSYRNLEIVLAPATAAAGANVVRTVAGATCVGRGVVVLRLKPGAALPAGGGTLILAPASLPAARLYDASNSAVLLDVGAAQIASALQQAGLTSAQGTAFANRFQGGLRVAPADLDGDGVVDLATAPGAIPTGSAATVANVGPLVQQIGDAPRVITVYNGNPSGTWQSASVNVSSVFGATYTGGFVITLGDVRTENAGSGSAVAELIVASTTKVAVFEVAVAARGGQPTISPAPTAAWTAQAGRLVTGLTSGDFSAAATNDIVVATTTTAGHVVPARNDVARTTAFVQAFSAPAASFVPGNAFSITSLVPNGPAPGGYLQNVFFNGAGLAAGDIDGAPDSKPELVLAATANGLANYRVLANSLVASGSQQAITQALTAGNGFTLPSRSQTVTIRGKQVWQPAGGPDSFTGMASVPNAVALGANAPLAVAVVDADGKNNARAEVFAALGATNSTHNVIRRIQWTGSAWTGAATLNGPGTITVVPPLGSMKTRFPLGRGLRLG